MLGRKNMKTVREHRRQRDRKQRLVRGTLSLLTSNYTCSSGWEILGPIRQAKKAFSQSKLHKHMQHNPAHSLPGICPCVWGEVSQRKGRDFWGTHHLLRSKPETTISLNAYLRGSLEPFCAMPARRKNQHLGHREGSTIGVTPVPRLPAGP